LQTSTQGHPRSPELVIHTSGIEGTSAVSREAEPLGLELFPISADANQHPPGRENQYVQGEKLVRNREPADVSSSWPFLG
jgi:hypothetical protein